MYKVSQSIRSKERFRYRMKANPKKMLASALKYFLIAIVAVFTALLSFNFWQWTFPPDQWYFAILGFGLTGGGTVVYLVMLLWDDNTNLRNTISLVMLIVSIIGELVTAGFGIKVETWTRAGFAPTQQDFEFMTMAVQVLLLFHFLAIVVYFAGDKIAEMFGDADGDGVRNYRDRDYQPRPQNAPRSRQEAPRATQQQQGTSYTLEQFCAQIGLTPDQARNIASATTDHNTAFDWLVVSRNMSDNTDISGKNFRKIFYRDLNPPVAAGVNGKNQP
jgi:hypothetical protein